MSIALTRDQFREGVFERDQHKCVICRLPGVDAHHIVERRLFPDGGYFMDNGATLCADHHIRAEQTLLTCEEIRKAAGIDYICLPGHLYKDERYDKWGNPFLANGQRLKGELFHDHSVQKSFKVILPTRSSILELFTYHGQSPKQKMIRCFLDLINSWGMKS